MILYQISIRFIVPERNRRKNMSTFDAQFGTIVLLIKMFLKLY